MFYSTKNPFRRPLARAFSYGSGPIQDAFVLLIFCIYRDITYIYGQLSAPAFIECGME